jgi:HEAT repeat protein
MTRAEQLRHPSADQRVHALADVVSHLSSAWPTADELSAMIECLGSATKAVQRRAATAVAACARIDPRLAASLHEVVRTGSWRQRWGAVFALSLSGSVPQTALPTLLEALNADDGDIRWAAAGLVKDLVVRDAPTVLPVLFAAAARQGARNQRKMALYCLRDLQVGDGAAVAVEALSADAADVRLAALATLVSVARDKAAAAVRIALLLRDPDAGVRRAAAAALGQLGSATPDILEVLRHAASADDPSLRRAAEQALRTLVRS